MSWYKLAQPMLPLEERGDAFEVGIGLLDADFYLRSKGSKNQVGDVFKEVGDMSSPIGIKVLHTDRFDPAYMYYYFKNLKESGIWKNNSHGVLNLKHIRVTDVKKLLNQIDRSNR